MNPVGFGGKIQNAYQGFRGEGDLDVGELFEHGLVGLLYHLLKHVDVLEDREPKLGHSLDILFIFLLVLAILDFGL